MGSVAAVSAFPANSLVSSSSRIDWPRRPDVLARRLSIPWLPTFCFLPLGGVWGFSVPVSKDVTGEELRYVVDYVFVRLAAIRFASLCHGAHAIVLGGDVLLFFERLLCVDKRLRSHGALKMEFACSSIFGAAVWSDYSAPGPPEVASS